MGSCRAMIFSNVSLKETLSDCLADTEEVRGVEGLKRLLIPREE